MRSLQLSPAEYRHELGLHSALGLYELKSARLGRQE